MPSSPAGSSAISQPTIPALPKLQLSVDAPTVAYIILATFFLLGWSWAAPRVNIIKLKLTHSVSQDIKLRSLLAQILAHSRADRVLLIQFHNQDRFSSGRHFSRMTATHEVLAPGRSPTQHLLMSVPSSMMADEINAMSYDHDLCMTVPNMPSGTLRGLLESVGTERLLARLLARNGKPLGIIMVHYLEDQTRRFWWQRRSTQATACEVSQNPEVDRCIKQIEWELGNTEGPLKTILQVMLQLRKY